MGNNNKIAKNISFKAVFGTMFNNYPIKNGPKWSQKWFPFNSHTLLSRAPFLGPCLGDHFWVMT